MSLLLERHLPQPIVEPLVTETVELTKSTLTFDNDIGGTVTIGVDEVQSEKYDLTLPITAPQNTNLLQSDENGQLSWVPHPDPLINVYVIKYRLPS